MGRSQKAGMRSAVASAAYRAGQKLVCERTGVTHDYRHKADVAHAEIIAPEGSPGWASDRAELWNNVEAVEKRRDAQLAREVRLSIPHQLDEDQRLELVRSWVTTQLVSRGMVADVAIHEPHHEGKNLHAHIMLTTRRIDRETGVFGGKAREWNSKDLLIELRESWAVAANDAAEKAGHAINWTHLSNAAQVELAQASGDTFTAIAKSYAPTQHEGPKVQAVRKKLQAMADKNGISLLEHCQRLIDEGEGSGAKDLIIYNEQRRLEREARLEQARAQRELEQAKAERARVVYAEKRFEERRAQAAAEEQELLEREKADQLASLLEIERQQATELAAELQELEQIEQDAQRADIETLQEQQAAERAVEQQEQELIVQHAQRVIMEALQEQQATELAAELQELEQIEQDAQRADIETLQEQQAIEPLLAAEWLEEHAAIGSELRAKQSKLASLRADWDELEMKRPQEASGWLARFFGRRRHRQELECWQQARTVLKTEGQIVLGEVSQLERELASLLERPEAELAERLELERKLELERQVEARRQHLAEENEEEYNLSAWEDWALTEPWDRAEDDGWMELYQDHLGQEEALETGLSSDYREKPELDEAPEPREPGMSM